MSGKQLKIDTSQQVKPDISQQPPSKSIGSQELSSDAPTSGRSRRGRHRRQKTEGIAVVLPGGDDRVYIDPADINQEESEEEYQVPYVPQRPSTAPNDVILVQERGHFKRKTRQEIHVKTLKTTEMDEDVGDVTEQQTKKFIKHAHMIIMAMSYLAYGLLAGMGLFLLMISPVIPPSAKLQSSPVSVLVDMLGFTSSPLVVFLSFYSPIAINISNTFTVLSVLALVQALETRSQERQTRKKAVELAKSGDQDHHLTSRQKRYMRRRGVATSLLIIASWALFLSNLAIFSVEDRLYSGYTSSQLHTNLYTPASIGYKASAYSTNGTLVAQSSVSVSLEWFWYEIASAVGLKQTQPSYPPDFTFDLTWWCAWNFIRGLSSILCFLFALIEIKFRPPIKRK